MPGRPGSFDLIFSSPTLRATDRAFREEMARALLVPATMRLMGRSNWWVPAPLARLCRWERAPAARGYSTGGG